MRLLFDQNLSHKLARLLADIFPGSAQVRLLDLGRANDREIWEVAKTSDHVIVSLDSDFAEMAQLRGPPPKVVWLRCGNQPTGFIADLLRRRASAIEAFCADDETACLEIY